MSADGVRGTSLRRPGSSDETDVSDQEGITRSENLEVLHRAYVRRSVRVMDVEYRGRN